MLRKASVERAAKAGLMVLCVLAAACAAAPVERASAVRESAPEAATAAAPAATQLAPTIAAGGLTESSGGFSCAIDETGQVWCWGFNGLGQLGDGTTDRRVAPVRVHGLDDARSISAGPSSACAVRSNATVWCWGQRSTGILGDGDGLQRLTSPQFVAQPVQVPAVSNAAYVSVGHNSACALLMDRTVKCWGEAGWGLYGDAIKRPGGYPVGPGTVVGVNDAVAVSVGMNYACAVLSAGLVTCWGTPWPWAMGTGEVYSKFSEAPSRPPTILEGLDAVTEISVTEGRGCALSSGELWCWGQKADYSSGSDRNLQSLVAARIDPPSRLLSIEASNAMCGIVPDRTASCWGDRNYYQLGDGRWWGDGSQQLIPNYPPVTVLTGRDTSVNPAIEFPLLDLNQLTISGTHSCASQLSGDMYCWGLNTSGQLGDGRPGWFDVSFKFATKVQGLPPVMRPSLISVGSPEQCVPTTVDRDCDGLTRVAVVGDSYIAGEGANQRTRYLGCTNAYLLDCDRNGDNQLTEADRLDSVQLKKFQGFAGQTGFSGNNCHRSSGSWGWQVAESLATAPALQNVLFAACSGAESKHVDAEAQYPDSPSFLAGGDSQVGHLRSFGSADVVFISLGGNDFGFGDVIASCYPLPLARCGGSDDERTRRLQQVTGRRANLVEALAAVKAAAPQATVYVNNYPLVVSSQSSCPGSDDLSWVRNEYLPAVNAAVAQAALQAGVRTIDLTGANDKADVQLGNLFAGHEVCIPDAASSWVNGLSRGEELRGMVGSESFHPTVVGHDAIRDAVRSQLVDSGRLGLLSNPAPVDQGIPPANGLPREVATFEIAPTGLQQDAFHGSVTGAPPDTDLTIRLHSEPLDLARVRTDASGDWQGIVELPTWASSGVHELEVLESASGTTLWRGVAFLGQAPSPQSDSATTDEGQQVWIDVLANDSDPDTALAELRLVSAQAVHGSVQIVDGGLRYTPAAGFVGQDSGTYEVCDVAEPCAQAAFTVEVLPAQVTGLQVSFEATGRRPWSGAGVVETSELQVVRNPDGKLASVRGAVTVPGPDGESYRVRLDVSNVLLWSFGSVTATDLRTGKEVRTFRLFADPLAEMEQSGMRSLVVTGAGLQFYRGAAYPSSLTVTLTGSV